ncbi:MAG: hypothetical protein LUD02_13140, partial [Tannerellaceae bacterium]|nr:hypothetical protein [Tannerellaceae bacterium]
IHMMFNKSTDIMRIIILYNYNKLARVLENTEMRKAESKIVTENLNGWKTSLAHDIYPSGVGNWFLDQRVPYSSLYPYKGQKNHSLKSIYPEGTREGTTSVWYCYQKLSDLLFREGEKSEEINFHEHFFVTALNQLPSAYYCDRQERARMFSVNKRLKMFAAHAFFRQFPVVLMVTGKYPDGMKIEIEDTFQVGLGRDEIEAGRDSMTICYNTDLRQLFIHTRQMGINSSDKLLSLLVGQIKPYLR